MPCTSQGIIDPAKVVRAALLNAASVSGLLLTADVAITELARTRRSPSTTPCADAAEVGGPVRDLSHGYDPVLLRDPERRTNGVR